MALINHRAREVHFKIVYYGPGLGGKTTNLQRIHDRLPPERRGRLVSLATDHERTLFFDFLPVDLGQIQGMNTRFHLYTVPGQVYYRLSRRAVLQGVDGIVFVADSHPAREHSNRESLVDLIANLEAQGLTEPLRKLPHIFQYNKRDLPAALPIARMREALNFLGAPEFEAVASTGQGVTETLRSICKAVLSRLAGEPSTGPQPIAAAVKPVAYAAAAPAVRPAHAAVPRPAHAAVPRPAHAAVPPKPAPQHANASAGKPANLATKSANPRPPEPVSPPTRVRKPR